MQTIDINNIKKQIQIAVFKTIFTNNAAHFY